MRAVIIEREEFERLFRVLICKYEYPSQFMHDDERLEDFEQTLRHSMLEGFKDVLRKLKQDMETA